MKFRNVVFTLKTLHWNVFRPHYAEAILKRSTHQPFSICVWQKLGQRNRIWLSSSHCFQNAPFLKCFQSALKRRSGVFKFLRFEERFRNSPFSWRISVDGRPYCRNKLSCVFRFLRRRSMFGFHLWFWDFLAKFPAIKCITTYLRKLSHLRAIKYKVTGCSNLWQKRSTSHS